ncbi:MAG: type II toxin-antitoxin system RelE/ParE family toxin [Gemmatimonadaceae bacterium]
MVTRPPLTQVEWISSARGDLRAFPDAVQDEIGYALYVVQCGEHPLQAKRLKGELGGLIELVEDFDGNTYRAVYTLKLRGAIYVLHAFQKKSTRGIATPRREIELIKARYARAREHHAAYYEPQEE